MNGSHIAGSGLGALIGAILVSLGTRIGLDLTNFDSATIGIAAVGVGLGIGHAIGEHGIIGVGQIILRGRAKPAVSRLGGVPVAPPTPSIPSPPAA